ncbi:hypothetical protein SNK03_007431 [Fusarium graminearum]|uniref:Chromosome 2, complete genome n=2 Tax=Gibberella zeae TaxID=5518 RepID=I1RKY8_GIBZE|nr:hypothetical protein FGSG_04560 [Fusarium graminearum PH-1]EYB27880.1 hypothetical protein FG05_04560 [Fusarium graminearum]ESU08527.1 hypothetical protein FGSG_04560 [Fusarium graminearum PH-1]KAI6773198.1 hypothetical protein HG531_000047 [Fusarium graminearum]PCD28453.1 hypothetical protein FGRA07_03592 [Fusarium graminearum]CAF3435334.1 unnamed protein product [Fusarium graminearum]|eukprot:XP_011321026.1 hypothetical protein FGSG_04560 [Fusarium graminearum PH-1]
MADPRSPGSRSPVLPYDPRSPPPTRSPRSPPPIPPRSPRSPPPPPRRPSNLVHHGSSSDQRLGHLIAYGTLPPDRSAELLDIQHVEPSPEPPEPSKPTSPSSRALPPDLLRGLLMLLMAMDHMGLALNSWSHGTGRETEMDGLPIKEWNTDFAYFIRTLTHLCAPGFTLLLGVGVVYLGRSRTKLGWSKLRIARYFAVRTGVLILANFVMGFIITLGKVWLMNAVLFSLAIDYFLAGMLWLAIDSTEPLLASALTRFFPEEEDDDEENEALLGGSPVKKTSRAESISWHAHNVLLAVLGLVTIWWNIWLSPTHGHCEIQDHATIHSSDNNGGPSDGPAVSHNPWFGLWFWTTITPRVMSVFPPMAWVSFAILGLLYGRIDVMKTWNARVSSLCHFVAGLFFFLLFVLTRVAHFGNLSEGCLQTPAHVDHPDRNQYLVSVQSFFYIMKYPPDVAFWAFTMAGNLFLLAIFRGIPTRVASRFTMLIDFGRAALFFYIVHMFFVFGFGAFWVYMVGYDTGRPKPMNPDVTDGIENPFAFLGIWALAMLMLWPVVRWYGRFKATKTADSLWRLF